MGWKPWDLRKRQKHFNSCPVYFILKITTDHRPRSVNPSKSSTAIPLATCPYYSTGHRMEGSEVYSSNLVKAFGSPSQKKNKWLTCLHQLQGASLDTSGNVNIWFVHHQELSWKLP